MLFIKIILTLAWILYGAKKGNDDGSMLGPYILGLLLIVIWYEL